jgi:hypothetical protein
MDTDEYIRPPGTYDDIIAHPTDANQAIEIAVVQDHRFAFFYWLKWWKSLAAHSQPPTLVSLDWHRDLYPPCADECQWLRALDTSDFKSVAFFCWDKLHCLNDGHVLAAAYLNIIGDIHVAQKEDGPPVEEHTDVNGNVHTVHCYDSIEALTQGLAAQEHSWVFFDIDLDYFTESRDPCGGGENLELVSPAEIKAILCPNGPLMSWIFPRIRGMTIATEPEFCGGLINSNNLLAVLSDALFEPRLLSHHACWKR